MLVINLLVQFHLFYPFAQVFFVMWDDELDSILRHKLLKCNMCLSIVKLRFCYTPVNLISNVAFVVT